MEVTRPNKNFVDFIWKYGEPSTCGRILTSRDFRKWWYAVLPAFYFKFDKTGFDIRANIKIAW